MNSMAPRVLRTDQGESINEAAKVIMTGGVIVVPTESFYGLAVNALNQKAIERVLAIKKRREDHPILILIHSADVLKRYVAQIPPVALRLIREFWPGGLTMVFEAKPLLPLPLTGGTGKIGVRLSSHPVPTQLARAAGVPITGTSANVTRERPCDNPEEALRALGSQVDMILDGGKTAGGKGSTVLDVTVVPPVIVREGMVSRKLLMPFFH
jgi:L-threonylcarbamoyladenylate synthase